MSIPASSVARSRAVLRLESLLIGVLALGFGVYLVSTGGIIAGVNLPGLIGLPSCGSSGGGATSAPCPGFAGYGVGTVVCLFGLGLIGNGLRQPSIGRGGPSGGAALPPELVATLANAQATMAAMRGLAPSGSTEGGSKSLGRTCPACGRSNRAGARFCEQCGQGIPPLMAVGGPSPATGPPSGSSPPPR